MNDVKKYSLILASQSPRRKEIFSWLGVPFLEMACPLEEVSREKDPLKYAHHLALQKVKWVYEQMSEEEFFSVSFFPFVVAADTIVTIDNEILGKPKNRDEARSHLEKLSGKTHTVISAVEVMYRDIANAKCNTLSFAGVTKVSFYPIESEMLEAYLDTKDSFDKAGGYGIQGMAKAFVKSVEGELLNVVGFPLQQFRESLREKSEFKQLALNKIFHGRKKQ